MSEEQQPTSYNEDTTPQEIIELLQQTIVQLNGVVHKLNTESIPNLPPRAMVDTLVSNTHILAELFGDTGESVPSTTEVTPDSATDELFFDEDDLDNGEPTEPALVPTPPVTPKSETVTPQSSRNAKANLKKLPQKWIAGIIALTVIVVIAIAVVFYTQSQEEIVEILPNPPLSSPEISSQPQNLPTPPQLESPGTPQPLEIAPPPAPKLTPEQSLIAAIYTEIEDLTHQYPKELISTIEANFLASRLIVTVSNDWNQLSSAKQEDLANSILQRSQGLNFRKLELIDQNQALIARSPVVGDKMIILSR